MEKYIKNNFKLFIFIFLGLAVFFAGIFANNFVANKNDYTLAFSEINAPKQSSVFNSTSVDGTIENNLLLFGFSDEIDDINNLNLYKPTYETFNTIYNIGDTSVKSFYYLDSNGKLDVDTPIITDDNTNAKIFITQKPRSYYLPYVVYKNSTYQINTNGYFDYFLVEAVRSSTYVNLAYAPYFYEDCKVISKVYQIPDGSNLPVDSDNSDGIMTYDEAQTLADSNSSYYLVDSYQRYFREYELLCDIYTKASDYITGLYGDLNADNFLDVTSFGLIDGNIASNYSFSSGYWWGSLLWPHQVEFDWISSNFVRIDSQGGTSKYIPLFTNCGYTLEDATTIVNYLFNKPQNNSGLSFNNINLTNFELNKVSTQTEYDTFIKDNSTIIHEFGHVLGLPDLYRYPSNDANSVGRWSHMCANPTKSSFLTSYEREKLGWLDENNIVEITYNGSYSLNVVSGLDGTNVVAYKIKDSTTDYRWIYLEYRNSTNQYFDSQSGQTGLLIYTVDTRYSSTGNMNAPPYEIAVQRPYGKTVLYATIAQGESLGDADKTVTTNAIIFGNQTSNPVNSGVVVTVSTLENNYLTFEVQSVDLLTAQEETYTVEDFNGNVKLYNKLLENLPQGQEKVLTYSSFTNTTVLNLNNCDIDDLSFLTLFDLSSVQYFNATENLITAQTILSANITSYSFAHIVVSGNFLDLSIIPSFLLNNSSITWGIQYTKTSGYYLNTLKLCYYYKSTDVVKIKVDGTNYLPVCSGTVGYWSSTVAGQHTITHEFTSGNVFDITSLSSVVSLVKIESLYNSDSQTYKMSLGESLPSIDALLSIEGIDVNGLIFDYQTPDVSVTGTFSFDVSVTFNTEDFGTYTIYYEIFSAPEVVFNNGKNAYIQQYDIYTEKGLTIYENGVEVAYTQNNSGDANTYYVAYYYQGGTINSDGTPNLSGGSQVDEIDTSIVTSYVVCYVVINTQGKLFRYYNQINISHKIIQESSMDSKIYNKLLELTSNNVLFVDSVEDFDVVDLSNLELTSIKGLSQLLFKQNAIINLSNNLLYNVTEITDFVSACTTVNLALMFNNFVVSDVSTISHNRANLMFGVQNIISVQFSDTKQEVVVADYYNDYSSLFAFDSQNFIFDEQNNKLKTNVFGNLAINFTSTGLSITNEVVAIYVNQLQTLITKNYNDNYVFDISHVIQVEGTSINTLGVATNTDRINFSEIGTKQVDIELSYNNVSYNFSQQYLIVDKIAPQITLNGDLVVYVGSVQDYYTLYSQDTCTAVDEYDGVLTVSTNVPSLTGYGVYTITYSASDQSGNEGSIQRILYVGHAYLSTTYQKQNYNIVFYLPLQFVVFTEDDFNITYKINDGNFVNYSSQIGIKLAEYNQHQLTIKLVHKQNSNLVYNFSYTVNIVDGEKPVIKLIGQSEMQCYAGEKYQEPGYEITDNATTGKETIHNDIDGITLNISYVYVDKNGSKTKTNFVDTTKIGTYVITYTAYDSSQNSNKTMRYVEIIYHPVEDIKIDSTMILSRYSQGKTITFNVVSESKYLIDPNLTLVWFVNGTAYKTTNQNSVDITFDQVGDYTISAVVYDSQGISTQSINIQIYQSSEYEALVMYIGIAIGTVCILSFVIYFINRYRKRNFY